MSMEDLLAKLGKPEHETSSQSFIERGVDALVLEAMPELSKAQGDRKQQELSKAANEAMLFTAEQALVSGLVFYVDPDYLGTKTRVKATTVHE